MKMLSKYCLALMICLAGLFLFAACSSGNDNQATATTTVSPPTAQVLTVTPRPPSILELMKQRGEQDQAKPALKIVTPAKDAVINGSTVAVKLELSGELKGYMP